MNNVIKYFGSQIIDNFYGIDRVEDNSDYRINRVSVYFINGDELSIIRGSNSYGADQGLFEIMCNSKYYDNPNDNVVGRLTYEEVVKHIVRISDSCKESKDND